MHSTPFTVPEPGDLKYLHTPESWAELLKRVGFQTVRATLNADDMKVGAGKGFCAFEAFLSVTPAIAPVLSAAPAASASAGADLPSTRTVQFLNDWLAYKNKASAALDAATIYQKLLAAQKKALGSKPYKCLESLGFAGLSSVRCSVPRFVYRSTLRCVVM